MVVENIRGDAWSLIQVDHGQGTLSVHVRSASPMALQGTPLISVRLQLRWLVVLRRLVLWRDLVVVRRLRLR